MPLQSLSASRSIVLTNLVSPANSLRMHSNPSSRSSIQALNKLAPILSLGEHHCDCQENVAPLITRLWVRPSSQFLTQSAPVQALGCQLLLISLCLSSGLALCHLSLASSTQACGQAEKLWSELTLQPSLPTGSCSSPASSPVTKFQKTCGGFFPLRQTLLSWVTLGQ